MKCQKKELEEKKAKQKEEMSKKSAQVKTERPAFAKGAVIKITGLGGEITRENLKTMLQKNFKVNDKKKRRRYCFHHLPAGTSRSLD